MRVTNASMPFSSFNGSNVEAREIRISAASNGGQLARNFE
jgi:hypothetical protein